MKEIISINYGDPIRGLTFTLHYILVTRSKEWTPEGMIGGKDLFIGVRRIVLLPSFTGVRSRNRVHFFQLVLRVVNRNFGMVFNPLGGDCNLWERQVSALDLDRRFVKKFTCMFVIPVGDSCVERARPSLNKILDLLSGSAKSDSGSSDLDGGINPGVVGILSSWSGGPDVTQ